MTDPVDLLRQLILIPSVNPRDRAEPAETPLAEFVRDWAHAQGFPAELHEVIDGRHNVVVTVPGADPARAVLLETHLDTVELPVGVVTPEVTVDEATVRGRGACDAKGPLACFMAAISEFRVSPPPVTVRLAAVIDEEHHYKGVTGLLADGSLGGEDYVGAIVGEPTDTRVVAAHMGVIRCRIHASTRGGHSSLGHLQPNAVVAVSEAILALHRNADAILNASTNPLLSRGSLAVTRIEGGEGDNVIPAHCVAVVDRRLAPGETPEEVLGSMRAILSRDCPGVTIDEPFTLDIALDTDPASTWVRRSTSALTGPPHPADPVGAGWGSGASKIAAAGIECIVWGPGSIAVAHTDQEHIPVAQLSWATDRLAEFLRAL